MRRAPLLLVLFLTIALSGCYAKQRLGLEAASRLAGPAFMMDRTVQAGDFQLKLYERVHDRGGIANIYIEGDDPSIAFDGMSDHLIGLHLASRDRADNVIYMARPCQFTQHTNIWKNAEEGDQSCDLKYLSTHRFAPEVMRSYNLALDDLRQRWGIKAFNLYGHSGGGVLAVLLAAERSDVFSVTTVEAMLDLEAYSDAKQVIDAQKWNKQKPFSEAISPVDVAANLNDMPQYHYIGGADDEMPPAALYGYLAKIGPTNCVYYQMIQENGYTAGWVEKWPDLLQDKPVCNGKVQPVLAD